MPESMTPLIILGVVGALFILLLSLLTNNYSLNNIKSKTVGDGQYGTARWATDQEIRKAYITVPFDVASWRAGKSLYGGFNDEYVESVKKLVKRADVIVPNITEACFLTGSEYQTKQSTEYIEGLIAKLTDICPSKVVLTGVSFREDTIGVAYLDGDIKYAFSERIPKSYHGTGDVFASALAGCLFGGEGLDKATRLAIRFVLDSIRSTENEHWYGVRFEKAIPNLIENLKK